MIVLFMFIFVVFILSVSLAGFGVNGEIFNTCKSIISSSEV